MLYAKPCCAVDPIENEEDRKKVRPGRSRLRELWAQLVEGGVLFLLAHVFLNLALFSGPGF